MGDGLPSPVVDGFCVGDRVRFHFGGEREGVITGFAMWSKRALIVTDSGRGYTCGTSFLARVEDARA